MGGGGTAEKLKFAGCRPPLHIARACNQENDYACKNIGEKFPWPKILISPSSTCHRATPKPPANLGPAGINLWRLIMAEYDVSDAGGQALLEQAALACDRAERLRAEIDAAGEILHTRSGPREHPGLKAELASRSFVCRTLQRLGINLEAVRMAPGRPSGPAWRGHGD